MHPISPAMQRTRAQLTARGAPCGRVRVRGKQPVQPPSCGPALPPRPSAAAASMPAAPRRLGPAPGLPRAAPAPMGDRQPRAAPASTTGGPALGDLPSGHSCAASALDSHPEVLARVRAKVDVPWSPD
jgi:hypothetical protein